MNDGWSLDPSMDPERRERNQDEPYWVDWAPMNSSFDEFNKPENKHIIGFWKCGKHKVPCVCKEWDYLEIKESVKWQGREVLQAIIDGLYDNHIKG